MWVAVMSVPCFRSEEVRILLDVLGASHHSFISVTPCLFSTGCAHADLRLWPRTEVSATGYSDGSCPDLSGWWELNPAKDLEVYAYVLSLHPASPAFKHIFDRLPFWSKYTKHQPAEEGSTTSQPAQRKCCSLYSVPGARNILLPKSLKPPSHPDIMQYYFI